MPLTDRLRGLYVKSPLWARRGAGAVLGFVPRQIVYGSTYRRLRSELETKGFDAAYVSAYQLAGVRRIIRLCLGNSDFYRRRLSEAFGELPGPDQFLIADLNRLPVLSKEDVRQHARAMLVTSEARADLGSTSGSSGRPLAFYLDKDRGAKEWAFVNHIWSRIGYRPTDRRAVLRGIHIVSADRKPWEYDAALRELRLSPFHLSEPNLALYLDLIKRYKIAFIHGYPSAITALAAHALAISWRPSARLRGILPVSETLFPHQRKIIAEAFGAVPMLPFYGLSEKVAIAGELVGQPNTYEFEPLYGITDLVDQDGVPVTEPGQTGRIVSTGLLSTAMPLLRYDTGDTGVLCQAPAEENGLRLRVKNIRSRWSQEYLVTSGGVLVSMTALNIHSDNYSKIKEFQLFQNSPGEAVVRVVPSAGHDATSLGPFVDELQRKVGAGIRFSLEIVEQIASNGRGKRSFIEQHLNLGELSPGLTAEDPIPTLPPDAL